MTRAHRVTLFRSYMFWVPPILPLFSGAPSSYCTTYGARRSYTRERGNLFYPLARSSTNGAHSVIENYKQTMYISNKRVARRTASRVKTLRQGISLHASCSTQLLLHLVHADPQYHRGQCPARGYQDGLDVQRFRGVPRKLNF